MEICSVCGRSFHLFSIEDKSRPMRPTQIVCPYGNHVHRSETSTRTFVCLPAGSIPRSAPSHQPNPHNGKSHME